MKNDWRRAFRFIVAVLFIGSALRAEEKCPVEVKVLLSPQTTHTVIASLRFEKETTGRVYFFDTDELGLLKQGVIVRVRQGTNNDLTVKVRAPAGNSLVNVTQLREHFPCETNRTGAGEDTDYAVRNKYKVLQVPQRGSEISNVLSPPQKRLLREAGVAIDWSQVKRIADIKATEWETTAQSPFRKLALELWEWRTGNMLELSTKVAREAAPSKSAELQQLVDKKGLSLSAKQGGKTGIVLEMLTNPTAPPR
jgi:hypothetical protein